MVELKKCPFCGGEAEIIHYDNDGYLPMCRECNGMIENWFSTKQKAAKAWNERADVKTWLD